MSAASIREIGNALVAARGSVHGRASDLEAVLDLLGCGVIVVDELGFVASMNASARDMTATATSLFVESGLLVAVRSDERRRLRDLIESALGPDEETSARAMRIRNRWGEPRLAIRIEPTAAGAAVFVTEAGTPHDPPDELLQQLYDLTPTEAKVLRYLTRGSSPAQIAMQLGVELSTARSHLRSIFLKTSTSGQCDLVRKVAIEVPAIRRGKRR
jgi:DNA-binding CsgD family transcriptional regulator